MDNNLLNPLNHSIAFSYKDKNDELKQFNHNIVGFTLPAYTTEIKETKYLGVSAYQPASNFTNTGIRVEFLADETMIAYKFLFDWIHTNTTDHAEFKYSDILLTVLSSANNPVKRFKFTNAFPFGISEMEFNTTSEEIIPTFTADFAFSEMFLVGI